MNFDNGPNRSKVNGLFLENGLSEKSSNESFLTTVVKQKVEGPFKIVPPPTKKKVSKAIRRVFRPIRN